MAVNWPSGLTPASVEIGIRFNTQVSVSELSGYVQTVELPGARWTISLAMAPLERSGQSAVLEAFLASLRGQAVRAVVPVFGRSSPLGTWGGSPTVNNELGSPTQSQTGTSLQVQGFSPFATVKAGDYFNLGSSGQLLMVTSDGTADSSGMVTISVQPAIRTAPSHGTALVSTNPVVPLMILSDQHPRWRIRPGDMNEASIEFVEVFA